MLFFFLMIQGAWSRSARHHAIEGVKRDFVAAVAAASAAGDAARGKQHFALLDVGANTGTFAEMMMERLSRAAPREHVHLVMYEPQPQFRSRLGSIARRWRGTHVGAAAWTQAGNLSFFLNDANSEAATLEEASATSSRGYRGQVLTVPAVDLAEHLLETLPVLSPQNPNASLAFLKLDVEVPPLYLWPRNRPSSSHMRSTHHPNPIAKP